MDMDPKAVVASLKACAKKKNLYQGDRLHARIVNSGLLHQNIHLTTTLVSMYAKCGALAKAQHVLDEFSARSVVPWNALMAGCVQQDKGKEALRCFEQMTRDGVSPDAITYASILKACGITREADLGKHIHDEVVSRGLLEKDVVLGTTLVDMYAKCGLLAKAHEVLDGLPSRDVVSWSALIAGYTQQGKGEEALTCYQQMRGEGLFPNAITYACVLKACGLAQKAGMGKQIHDEIDRQGMLQKNVVLSTALIDMYAKCGALTQAEEVLDEISVRNTASWNALMAGYVQQRNGKKAFQCYVKMQDEGLSPDVITYSCILKACGLIQEVDQVQQIHDKIASQGLLENNVMLGTILVDMYAKCGEMSKAKKVLDELPLRSVISWNALIAGYAQCGQGKEALECYQQMQGEGLSPDAIAYASVLKACALTHEAECGKQIHDEVVRQGLLEENVVLGTTLVDMYAKCGVFRHAQKVLDQLQVRNIVSWSALIAGHAKQGQGEEAMICLERMQIEGLSPNVVSWNALIGGYAQQGLAEEALGCFELMQTEGTSPDARTFACLLNACSHSGLVDEGQTFFESMKERYGITPNKKHYTCMVDLYGRAQHLDKALGVIKKLPSSDHPPLWWALLGACQKWGDVKLGRMAFDHAVQLDKCDAAAYVVMSNILASAGLKAYSV